MPFGSVSIYIRKSQPKRRYERVKRTNPQQCGIGDVYCLHVALPGSRHQWVTVGTDLKEVLRKQLEKEQDLFRESTQPVPPQKTPRTLEELRASFLHDKRTSRKKDGTIRDPETIASYAQTIGRFLAATGAKLPPDVTRETLKKWKDDLYEHPYAHWTVCNIYSEIATFLKFCAVDHKQLLREDERPTPREETPIAFTTAEMEKFFFVITNERDELVFRFLLKTGAREKEMTHLEWTDLNLGENPTVKFQCKLGFQTKTRKNRTVPLERTLADKLAAWRVKNPTTRYVFGTKKDKPEGHYLRVMKDIAKRAGMDRETFWLHKMRDTFATWALRRGVDLRTIQHWLGHTDISVTARYLAPEEDVQQQDLINKAFKGMAVAVSA